MKLLFICFTFLFIVWESKADGLSTNNNVVTTSSVATNFTNASFAKNSQEAWLKAAHEYDSNSVGWSNEGILDVARGYIFEARYNDAIVLYKIYLKANSTNVLAIRELGKAYILIGQYDNAEYEFKLGWHMGDDYALRNLANTYVLDKNYASLRPIVGDLFKLRDRMTNSNDKHDITNALIVYSLAGEETPNEQLFLETIDSLSDEFILGRKDTAQVVIQGLEAFGFTERAEKLKASLKQ